MPRRPADPSLRELYLPMHPSAQEDIVGRIPMADLRRGVPDLLQDDPILVVRRRNRHEKSARTKRTPKFGMKDAPEGQGAMIKDNPRVQLQLDRLAANAITAAVAERVAEELHADPTNRTWNLMAEGIRSPSDERRAGTVTAALGMISDKARQADLQRNEAEKGSAVEEPFTLAFELD